MKIPFYFRGVCVSGSREYLIRLGPKDANAAVDISDSEPTDARLEDVLEVVDYVKKQGVTPASYVFYNYRDKSYEARDSAGQRRYQYGFHTERDELEKIDSADDLRMFKLCH